MLRAFVTCVLVAVIEKLPVTVRLAAFRLPKLWIPAGAKIFPTMAMSPLTTRESVDVLVNTFRAPWTLL